MPRSAGARSCPPPPEPRAALAARGDARTGPTVFRDDENTQAKRCEAFKGQQPHWAGRSPHSTPRPRRKCPPMVLTEAAVQRHAPGPPRGGWPGESSHRHLAGASQPSGEGEPGPRLQGVRGPDQVCPSQPLLDQMGLSQWSSGQRTTTLPALGPHEDSGSAWEPQRWPGHSHCGDLPETGILIFPVTVRTLVLPVSR